MADFHFLRPLWLLLLLVLPLLPVLLRNGTTGDSGWKRVIPAHLLTPLFEGPGGPASARQRRWIPLALLVTALSLALAGPAWREAPTPLQQQNDSLVIVLDLSLSMLATDVQPDRLTLAKRKIRDILAEREASLTALVVYAADAHVVTPLTDDQNTIEGMLDVMDPLIMPAAGNRADLGIARALPLLENGARGDGRILLITDDVREEYRAGIERELDNSPYTLSTLVVGTEAGGPIPLPRHGFIRENGNIVLARTNPAALQSLAESTGGRSHLLTLDDQDLTSLKLRSEDSLSWQESERDLTVERWQDDGYWLLWLALPLVVLCWRQGGLLVLALLIIPALPSPALALEWDDLWQRPDQRGEALIQRDPQQAAERFDDPQWQGSALYRAGEYEGAARAFAQSDSPGARYNRGNALARSGKLEEALAEYDAVLEQAPEHPDALANRDLVQQLLEQQSEQQSQGNDDQGQQGDEGDNDPSQSSDQQGDQQDRSGEQPPEDGSGEQDSESSPSQDSGQQQGQSQNAEEGESPPEHEQQSSEAAQAEQDPADEGREAEAPSDINTSPLSQGQEQWLRRVPDDPGGLLRRKFLQQYQNRATQPDKSDTPW